jgi:Flp pilus assembly CpaF family ATPase
MNFELILPFLRPIEPLLLDESVSEIMGNPDASWWYERDGIMLREPFNFVAVQERCFAPEEISTLHP